MKWFTFAPVDTLYVRGAEPMEMGADHSASSIFPPPVYTIQGAIRTAYLTYNNINYKDYKGGKCNNGIYDTIGKHDGKCPFNVIGPLFIEKEVVFIPAPYTWFSEPFDSVKYTGHNPPKVKLLIAKKVIDSSLLSLLCTKNTEIYWAKGDNAEVKSLGGNWININDICKNEGQEIYVYSNDYFYLKEPHTGIALTKNRYAREHHLYTFVHSRLKQSVKILFGIDKDNVLSDIDILKVGAEQRFGKLEKFNKDLLDKLFIRQQSNNSQFLALSTVEGTQCSNNSVIATGKIQYFGGWDIAKGFHKPLKGYYPAGTVFNKKINENCISFNISIK